MLLIIYIFVSSFEASPPCVALPDWPQPSRAMASFPLTYKVNTVGGKQAVENISFKILTSFDFNLTEVLCSFQQNLSLILLEKAIVKFGFIILLRVSTSRGNYFREE